LEQVEVSEALPEALAQGLTRFKARMQNRAARLDKLGHERAPLYVRAAMGVPQRFAAFLHERGITRWDALRKRDAVDFLAAHPGVPRAKLERFLRFLNEDRPFRETRGRPPSRRKGGNPVRSAVVPEVIPPEEVTALLAEVRKTHTDAEYMLAWLIGRMGMRASAAFGLTLDRIADNELGQLVMRPAQVWVVVPKAEAAILRKLVLSVAPDWNKADRDSLKYVTIFDHFVPRRLIDRILKLPTNVLRRSAIYAAMKGGHVDRVTLMKTMGVSSPTIVRLEALLSADLHRRFDPAFVEKRNKYILGEVRE
jgi:hypothetical protein